MYECVFTHTGTDLSLESSLKNLNWDSGGDGDGNPGAQEPAFSTVISKPDSSSFKSDPHHLSIATTLVPATTVLTQLEYCTSLLSGLPASTLVP